MKNVLQDNFIYTFIYLMIWKSNEYSTVLILTSVSQLHINL